MCYSRAYVYQTYAENVYDQVLSVVQIVEGSVLPQSIADSKQRCTEGVQSHQLEAFEATDCACQELWFCYGKDDNALTNTARDGRTLRQRTRQRRRWVLPC